MPTSEMGHSRQVEPALRRGGAERYPSIAFHRDDFAGSTHRAESFIGALQLPLMRKNRRCAPLTEVGALFDHLVGAGEQDRRDGEAKCSCRVEVDYKLKFCRLLDG
jgi:hypothetical protein